MAVPAAPADDLLTKEAPTVLSSATSRPTSPNRGASVPDVEAVGPKGQSKAEWQKQQGIDTSKQIRLVKLSHMRYQHPNLQEIHTFLKDFGLTVIKRTETQAWYRGYGPDQYVYYAQQGSKKFLGGTFEVESYQELEKIQRIKSVKVLTDGIEELKDAPGGGHMITIEDPEGFPINFIYGQTALGEERLKRIHKPSNLVVNSESEKPRQRSFQRFKPGPAEVHKLGHFGLVVKDFVAQLHWYTQHFNFLPSDILSMTDPDSSTSHDVAVFAHLDRGNTPTDHHTMFLTQLTPDAPQTPHVHHASFEIHDFDTQALGHQWLVSRGYDPVWGIGRHILGSQLFDYWWDPTGFMVEHYADGDLVTADTPLARGPASHEGLAVWGPDVPKEFLD